METSRFARKIEKIEGSEEKLGEAIATLTKLSCKIREGEKEICRALTDIGEIIINDCRFCLGDGSKFIPMWVELYYFNKEQNYEDPTMDAVRLKRRKSAERLFQINHYGHLYFAGAANYRRVDLVLSDGESYGLSVLIKAGKKIHDGKEEFMGQIKTRDELEGHISISLQIEDGLNSSDKIVNCGATRRVFSSYDKGTEEEKMYKNLCGLAVYRSPFTFRKSSSPRTKYSKFLEKKS